MPIVLKAIDLEEVFDDDEFLLAWVGKSIEEGRSFGGYSGNIYSHKKYGNAEIYSCLVVNPSPSEFLTALNLVILYDISFFNGISE